MVEVLRTGMRRNDYDYEGQSIGAAFCDAAAVVVAIMELGIVCAMDRRRCRTYWSR